MSVTPAQVITLLPKYKLSTVHIFLKVVSSVGAMHNIEALGHTTVLSIPV